MAAWTDTSGPRRRRQPRAALALECVLTRPKGGPVWCRTLDVGLGGMRVQSTRPLGVDELLHFDLPAQAVDGDARVLREHAPMVYALRIEALRDDAALRLSTLAPGLSTLAPG